MVVDITDSASGPSLRQLIPLFALSGSLAAGYGVLFTLVGDYRDDYGISETMVGVIIGIGFIASFVAQTFLGPLGDQGRAKQMIIAGTLANIVGLLLLGFGTTAPVLLIGRVISGLGIGAAIPAAKRMVVVGSGENLGRNLGVLFSADVFGFALGPVVSALLVGPFGISGPFIVMSAMCALFAVAVLVAAPDDHPVPADEVTPTSRFAVDLLRNRQFAGAVVLGTAGFVMIGAFDALWDVVHSDLDTPEWMANLGIALFAVPLVLLGPIAGRIAQLRGPFRISAIGLVAAAMFMGIYGISESGSTIFGFTMGHAITDGLTFAAAGVAVAMTAPESRQAGAQGLLGGMQSLGTGIMAPITGWIYEHQGQQAAYWTGAIVIFAMAAAGMLLAGPSAWSVHAEEERDLAELLG